MTARSFPGPHPSIKFVHFLCVSIVDYHLGGPTRREDALRGTDPESYITEYILVTKTRDDRLTTGRLTTFAGARVHGALHRELYSLRLGRGPRVTSAKARVWPRLVA